MEFVSLSHENTWMVQEDGEYSHHHHHHHHEEELAVI
jgi:hypothetical protein